MSIHTTTFFTAIFCASLVLFGCSEPESGTPVDVAVEEIEIVTPEKSGPETQSDPVENEKEAVEPEPEVSGPIQPKLVVEKKDGKIVVEGFIKSSSHKDRIREQLTEAFPGIEVVDNMIVNFDCVAVAWTGRVTEQLLIPYFQKVEDPYVEWTEGMITLKGTVKNMLDEKDLTIIAIDAFAGAHTIDMDSQIKVASE